MFSSVSIFVVFGVAFVGGGVFAGVWFGMGSSSSSTENSTAAAPTMVSPSTVVTAAPTTVATAAPSTVVTAAPTTVVTAAPTTVVTAAPTTPSTAAPTTPSTAAPTAPSTAAPTTPSTKYVIYFNTGGEPAFGWNPPFIPYLQNAKDAGYNTAILSFYLPSGYPTAHNLPGAPVGSPQLYAPATNGGYAPSKIPGLDVLLSVGGDQLIPPIDDFSFATAFGIEVGQFAANNGFDGLDFDIENMAFSSDDTVPWLIELTNRARESYFLIKGTIPIITHAPQSPYFNHAFAPTNVRDYTNFVSLIGDNVSWYNIQFYNQNHGQSEGVCTDDSGATIDCCYTTSIGLTTTSASDCPTNPDTSIAEIIAGGVPWQKLIVGKSIRASDGEGGQIFLPKTLKTLLTTTPETFYGGIMGWSWDGTTATFCNALYGAECT